MCVCVRACVFPKSCRTLCNPMGCSPSGSSEHGIFQSGMLEWLPFPPPADLPNPGIEPASPTLIKSTSPALQADASPLSCQASPQAHSKKYQSRTVCHGHCVSRGVPPATNRITFVKSQDDVQRPRKQLGKPVMSHTRPILASVQSC